MKTLVYRFIAIAIIFLSAVLGLHAEKRIFVHTKGNYAYEFPVAGTQIYQIVRGDNESTVVSTADGKEEFIDTNWIDHIVVEEKGSVESDRAALMAIYDNMTIQDQFAYKNWGSDLPLSEWDRVYVDSETGRVTTLYLNAVCVVNDFPEEIKNLTALRSLYIYTDNVNNAEVISSLQNLETLMFCTPNPDVYLKEIPHWISNLSKLRSLHLEIGLTEWGEFEIERLPRLIDVSFQGVPIRQNEPIGFPDFLNKTNLYWLRLNDLNLGCEIPQWVYNQTNLVDLEITNCNLMGEISSSISNLTELTYLAFNNNNLTGVLPSEICELKQLEYLLLFENKIGGFIPVGFSKLSKLMGVELYSNNLDGVIPLDFVENPNYRYWNVDQRILPQNSGYKLTLPGDSYVSTDFSADGLPVVLQTSKYGKGYDVILMGDGYTDQDIASGLYDRHMREAYENIFLLEPMKSYRDYVNVSYVNVVSPSSSFADKNTALECSFASGYDVVAVCNETKVEEYADKCERRNKEYCSIGVILNSNVDAGINSSYYGSFNSVSIIGHAVPGDKFFEKSFAYIINHELVGHGIGKLADEYWEVRGTRLDESIAQIAHDTDIASNVNANVDYFNDPEKIKWSHMLNDPQFSSYTGIYEGGLRCQYGVWHPESKSIMNVGTPYFNAPSREAIVKILNAACGLEYDYQIFKEKDVYNPAPFPIDNWDPQY